MDVPYASCQIHHEGGEPQVALNQVYQQAKNLHESNLELKEENKLLRRDRAEMTKTIEELKKENEKERRDQEDLVKTVENLRIELSGKEEELK